MPSLLRALRAHAVFDLFDLFALFATLALAAALAVLPGCGNGESATSQEGAPPGELVRSDKPRLTAAAPAADIATLTADDAAFGLDVLRKAAGKDNFFSSPHSLSIALAMTYGGARGATQAQMAKALRFTLPDARLHAAFGSLDLELARRADNPVESGEAFELSILNSLWGQRGYAFLPSYLDLLAENYGAGLSLLDFVADPEGSRGQINKWVSDRTKTRIPELIPQGVITPATVLVLTNAIYFKASWKEPFEESATVDGPFTKLDGTTSAARFMRQTKERRYASGQGWEALELPYAGDDVAMLFVLPAKDQFESFRAGFDGARLAEITGALGSKSVEMSIPRFSFRTQLAVKPVLKALGMTDAFEGGVADLSGMDGTRSLFIQDVIHEAFVAVDEKGTEAAAATAVVVGRTSIPERATFKADRPFFVVIRDNPTGAVLFVGQVTSP